MRLPALSVIIAVLAIIWCVAGSIAHTPRILLYPLAWGLIAAGFYVHAKMNPIRPYSSASQTSTSDSSQVADPQQGVEPEKMATG